MALIGARIMSMLPFGVPKVIATSAAMPAYVSEWFDSMDVVVMQIIMEFTGLNDLLTNAIARWRVSYRGWWRKVAPITP